MTLGGVLSVLSAGVAAAAMVMFLRSTRAMSLRSKLRAQMVAALLAELFVLLFVVRVLSAGQAYTAWPLVVGGGVLLAVVTVLFASRVRRWARELQKGDSE